MEVIRAILFDLDGVLVDFADYHFEALNDALRQHGFPVVKTEERERYEGLSTRQKLTMMVEQKRVKAGSEEAVYAAKQLCTMRLAESRVTPERSKILMCRLLRSTLTLGCVSNCVRASVDVLLKAAGLLEFMAVTVSNEDVTHPKPSPDPYLLAASLLGLSPSHCLAVEDHERGVQSATAAGCRVVQMQYEHVNLIGVKRALKAVQEVSR